MKAQTPHKLVQLLGQVTPPDFSALVAAGAGTLPLLSSLSGTPQNPVWHAEGDVAVHTAMVLHEMHSLLAAGSAPQESALILLGAALLHDIGKPLTTRIREFSGEERIVSPRHAEEGRSWLALRLPALGLPVRDAAEIMALTGFHHEPRRLVQDEAPAARWRLLARQCPVEKVYWLEQADLRGRRCPDLDAQLETLELFRLRCEELGLRDGANPWEDWRQAMNSAFSDRTAAFRRHALHAAVRDAECGVIVSVEEALARSYGLRDPAPELIILCGPSGAGKSEWVQTHHPAADVVSLDALREQLAGKRADQSMNGQVMQAAKESLKALLRRPGGGTIIWDATNLRQDGRGWVAQLGFDYGAHVTIAAMQTPLSTLTARNRTRPHPVPAAVLERQIASLEWPTADEAHEVLPVSPE